MAVLFLVVFIDLVGFGLLLPLLPFYVQRTGVGPEIITIVLGLYSLAQVLAAPVWGRLSDTYGRKPVLAVTTFGLGLSYLLLAAAGDSLALLVASRILGGVMAGNIAAAQAYVADTTTPETRAKGMGVLGAAFGLGFIIGPAIGGLLGGSDLATVNFVRPALAAAALSFLAAFGVSVLLKESLAREHRAHAAATRATFKTKLHAVATRRVLVLLVLTGFLIVTAFAQFETVFALWANQVFAYGPREIGFVLGLMGVVNVLVQGLLMGPLTKQFGERRLALLAPVLFIAGYIILTLETSAVAPVTTLAAGCTALALASALFNPAMTSLVSQQAAAHERGAVMGAYQSASALGRVAGPAFSGSLFALGAIWPFLAAGALAGVALILTLLARPTTAARTQAL